ncbi:MAG: hypothetical protein LQ337_007200 [Flavoplaca oasis]|nr:MAG: hypothetical protein LQ337_007200 [Flavoplaca oasis]
MLGIGRTSTQTTLASIETNVTTHRTRRNEPEAASAQACQSSPVPLQSPPLRVDTSGNSGHLSTIAEGVSPAQQSSAVVTPAISETHEWVATQHVQRDREPGMSEQGAAEINAPVQTDHLSKQSGRFWVGRPQRKLREKIRQHLQKPRSFDISRLGLHVDLSPTPSTPGRLPLPVASVQPTSARRTHNEPVQSNGVSLESAEISQQPGTARPDPLIGRTLTLPEKRERIGALRREATLKRRAELISRCECQSECQCRNGSVQSNAASLGPDSPERSIQVPVHPLQRLLGETSESSTSGGSSSGVNGESILAGVGSHLHPDGLLPDRWINMTPDSQNYFSDRMSQASTVYVRSNGSSGSLTSRRPASLGRSSTAPAPIARGSADGSRPDTRQFIRNRQMMDLGQGDALEVPSSPRGSDGEASLQITSETSGIPG